MTPPKTQLEQPTIPYVPTYEKVEPQLYDYFDRHDYIVDNYQSGDQFQLGKLKDELNYIRANYQRGLAAGDPASERQMADQTLAGLILDILNKNFVYEGKIPETLQQFREMIGEENYLSLNIIFTLREAELNSDVALASVSSSDSRVAKLLVDFLEKFEVDPSNMESLAKVFSDTEKNIFRYQAAVLTGSLKARFDLLFAKAANRAVFESDLALASKLLSKITYYREKNTLYKLSAKFTPDINTSSLYSYGAARNGKEYVQTTVGLNLLAGLRQYLSNDVEGHHDSFEMVLNDTAKIGFFKLNIPEHIIIKEGETLVFDNVVDTNIIGARFRAKIEVHNPNGVDPNRDLFDAKYDPETNRLIVTAQANTTDHEQYLVKLDLGMEITNADFTLHRSFNTYYTASTDALIENFNEPPVVVVEGPETVEEGAVMCMDVKEVRDPEGDPIQYPLQWEQKTGVKTEMTLMSPTRMCAQAKPTHRVEAPFSFEVKAQDVIDPNIYPLLASQQTSKYVTVFNIPNLEMAEGDFVKLPPEAIKILTDPNRKETAAVGFATEQSFYILLRLPTDIASFSTLLSANVGNYINVEGCDGEIEKREWFGMKKMPGNLFVYQAYSPVEKWTKPGVYQYTNHAFISLEDMKNPLWVEVPIVGEAKVENTETRVKITIGDVQELDATHLRIPFVIKNANGKDGKVIRYPEELTVNLKNEFGTDCANVTLTKNVVARRISGESESDVEYNIDFAMLPEYRKYNSTLNFSIAIEDVDGHPAKLSAAKSIPQTNTDNIFDAVQIYAPEGTMPFPWYQLDLKAPTLPPRLMEVLRLGSHYFRLVPPSSIANLVDRVELQGNPGLTRYSKDKLGLKVPLRIMDFYQQNVARSFAGVGGNLEGRSNFKLPDDLEHPQDGHWDALVEWGVRLSVAAIPGYPNGDDLLRAKKELEKKEAEQKKDVAEKKVQEDDDSLLTELGNILHASTKIEPTDKNVEAGEEFEIEISVPTDVMKKFTLNSLYLPYTTAADVLRIRLTNKTKANSEEYILGAVSMKADGNNKIVFKFRLPAYLPEGEYWVQARLREAINANYTAHYIKHDERMEKTFDVVAVKSTDWLTTDAVVTGKSKQETSGRGGITVQQKKE